MLYYIQDTTLENPLISSLRKKEAKKLQLEHGEESAYKANFTNYSKIVIETQI